MKFLFSASLIASASGFGLLSTPISSRSSTSLFALPKVFIDGEAGTTGLQVRDRLADRKDIEIISIPYELRKDDDTRKNLINEADVVILCLPDDASKQAASWVESDNDRTVLIDASTAFRVDDDWVYGFPGKKQQSTMQTHARGVERILFQLFSPFMIGIPQSFLLNNALLWKPPSASPTPVATPPVSLV